MEDVAVEARRETGWRGRGNRMRARLAQSGMRYRWMATPLALALGVRIALLFVADLGLRLLSLRPFPGHIGAWEQYDTVWYLSIVGHGYHQSAVAPEANFFPLLPLLMWLVGHVTSLFISIPDHAYLLAGMIVSWVAFVAACVVLYKLAWERFGQTTAYGTVLLLAVFPFSFYYGAAYTESLYLLAAVVAFYGVEHRRWGLASLAAAFAGASRPPGLLVGGCVVLAYALDWLRTRHGWRWDALWLLLTPLGTAAYFFYCWLIYGNALQYVKSSRTLWHGGHLQLTALHSALRLLAHPYLIIQSPDFNTILSSVYVWLTVLFVISLVPITRNLGITYAVFAFASFAVPLTTFDTLTSTGRYLSIVFPTFMVAAYYLRNRPVLQQWIVILSCMCLVMFTVLFLAAYPIY